jgi:hypothetical protein
MKRIKISFLALTALAALILSSCGGVDKMKQLPEGFVLKVTPNPLEVHGNMVKGTIEGTIPAKYFNKKAKVEVTPVLVYEGGELVLPIKILQGEDVQENNQVIPFEAGGSFKHDIEFEYKDAMIKSDLELRLVIFYKDKKIPFDAPQKIGVGVIATPKLVDFSPKPSMLKDNFVRVTSKESTAQINYVIQRSDVRKSELTKEEIATLEKFIAETAQATDKELKTVKISSYASPDGPEAMNDKLSKERGKAAEKWLGDIFKKAKLTGKPGDFVKAETTSEDWDGFQKLVQASDIQDKELILRVLSMYSDPIVREKEIKNMSKVFKVLAEKVLPELRRSKMIAKVDNVGYSDEQFKEMVENNNMDNLKVEEILYAATLFTDHDTKLKVYQKAAALHNDVRAHNNVAYIAILKGDVSTAKAAVEAASAVDATNPAVKNNKACVALMEGKYAEAESLFLGATNAGPEVKASLGAFAIAKGQYPAAVEYLAGTDSFNQGLAMLLTNKNDAAKNTFQKVDSAKSFYGLAIVGARIQDENMILNNLRTAIGKDASLKARAKVDLEFRNYFQNDAFKAIVD